MSYFLFRKPSVSYWFGQWQIILVSGILIWTVLVYFAFLCKLMGKSTATVFLLVIPCTVLVITSELQELQFKFISSALLSQDCSSNVQKVQLQQAWSVAKNTSMQCDKYLMNITGSPLAELEKVR